MRIALVCENFPEGLGKTPVFPSIWILANELSRLGHDVLVAAFGPQEQEEAVAVTQVDRITILRKRREPQHYPFLHSLPSFTAFSWQSSAAHDLFTGLYDRICQWKPDVIESQEFTGLGFFFALRHEHPLVIRCHGPISLMDPKHAFKNVDQSDLELVRALEMVPIMLADETITVCRDLAFKLDKRGIRPAGDFHFIRAPFLPFPQVDRVQPRMEPQDAFPKIFSWGRLEYLKGADLLIEALPHIVEKFPNAHVLLGGADLTVYGEKESFGTKLKKRLDELGMADRVEFLGLLNGEQIIANVKWADICVFPSRAETVSYTLLEAASLGTACVAAAVGGLPEYHEPGRSAWLVEPDNSEALAEGIIKVASDDTLRSTLQSFAPGHVVSSCDPVEHAKQSLGVYQQAIERFARGDSPNTRPALNLIGDCLAATIQCPSAAQSYRASIAGEFNRVWLEGRNAGIEECRESHERSISIRHSGKLLLRALKSGVARRVSQ